MKIHFIFSDRLRKRISKELLMRDEMQKKAIQIAVCIITRNRPKELPCDDLWALRCCAE
jgi:hypothetical protein